MGSLKKNFMATACVAAITLGATNAQAAALDTSTSDMNFYVSLFGGAVFDQKEKFSYTYNAAPYKANLSFDTGFIVGGAIGVKGLVHDNVRTELEFAYTSHDPKNWNALSTGGTRYTYNVTGNIGVFTILANVWYDFDMDSKITPYIGGGVGVGFVKNNMTLYTPAGAGYDILNKSTMEFAFQLGTGFKYDITQNMALDVGYRFRGVLGVDPESVGITAMTNVKNFDLMSHAVQVGVTFKLAPL